ncbi:hypothetical protein C8F04DRAFT_998527 [Mycena alexandri]|uniref:F-box domain-containing protein n=1 Tax=Mycena alexandri TaxID=1745969 RepID=A0AAD6T2F1_9AGAR|nr:hypothetical protein C8F04DRAFT_998527 [Mycena alexandri]
MSTTRRQSGRLAQQAISPAKDNGASARKTPVVEPKKTSGTEPQDEDDDIFEESEDEDDVESDASEYGRRPLKRQKTTKTATVKKSTKTATPKSRKVVKSTGDTTCHLSNIPLDVLLEIFGRLEPKDIIQLSRTNHTFRSHLLSKESRGVWKAARENVDGPDCHADLTEQEWAHLLYGVAQCQSCGAKNVQRVDFGLRRRACTGCLKANLVVTSSFKKRFPHLEIDLLDLIPYTNIGGHAHGYPSKSRFYWQSDIEEMAETLAAYDRDVHMRLPGARKALEAFTAERIALVRTVVNHAVACSDWSRDVLIRRQRETEQKIAARYEAIKSKFIELGYSGDDVSSIRRSTHVCQSTELTDRIWKRIHPLLEPEVQAQKTSRLKKEHDARIRERTLLVEAIYNGYKRTLVPAQWRYLPGLHEVCQSPAFSTIIDSPNDVIVQKTHFKEATAALPALVTSITAARKADLVQLIEAAHASEPDPFGARGSTSQGSGTRLLDLATTVFVCAQSHCSRRSPWALASAKPALIGWDAAVNHRCRVEQWIQGFHGNVSVQTILAFSKRGQTAAASLVKLAGSHQQMTAAQMDQLDLRFLCIACSPRVSGNKESHVSYSWRAAVSHFVEIQHAAPLWRQLSDDEAQQVKSSEGVDPTLSWSCNHCSHNLDACHTFAKVADHGKTVHKIANPSAEVDLFRCLDLPRPSVTFSYTRLLKAKKSKAGKPEIPGLQYNCLQCSTSGLAASQRVFKMEGVKSHLQAKHKIMNPVANQDWKQIQT